jgi:hypothetical protein
MKIIKGTNDFEKLGKIDRPLYTVFDDNSMKSNKVITHGHWTGIFSNYFSARICRPF